MGPPGMDGEGGGGDDSIFVAPLQLSGIPGQIPFFNTPYSLTTEAGVFPNSLAWDSTNNRLGIGVVLPTSDLHIQSNAELILRLDVAGNNPTIFSLRSNGAIGGRTGTLANNVLLTMKASGHDTASFPNTNAEISFNAQADFAVGNCPTQILFRTANVGAADRTTKATLAANGELLIMSGTQTLDTAGSLLSVRDGHISLKNTGTASELRLFEPSGAGAMYSSFKAGAQAATIDYTLPLTVGAANQVLTAQNGTGTLVWSSALQGIPGADGEDGLDSVVPGPQGTPGTNGTNGATGATGPPGFSGVDGDDGLDSLVPGPRGIAGTNGTNGTNGPAGPPGADGEGGGDGLEYLNGPTSPAGLKGEVQFNASGMFGANSAFFWDITNQRLGIGTSTPMAATDIEVRNKVTGAPLSLPDIRVNCFSTNVSSAPTLSFGRSEGTSPTSFGAVTLADTLGIINFVGDDSSGVATINAGVIIKAVSEETWTGASHACRLDFLTTNFGSANPSLCMSVQADTNVSFTADIYPRNVIYQWPNAVGAGALTSDAGGNLSWIPAPVRGPFDTGGAGDDADQFALLGPPPPRPTLATRATITIVTETEQYATNIADGAVKAGSTINAWTVNELDDIYFEAHANAGNFDLDMRALRPEFAGGLKGSINIAYLVM